MSKHHSTVLVAVAAIMLFTGCATTAETPLDPEMYAEVRVYPLVDKRTDRGLGLENLLGMDRIRYPVNADFMAREFKCIVRYAADTDLEPNISYGDLKGNNQERLKAIHTNGEKYVLVLYMNGFTKDFLRRKGSAAFEGFLVRSDTGTILWSGAQRGSYNKYGPFNRKPADSAFLWAPNSNVVGTRKLERFYGAAGLAYLKVLAETMRMFPVHLKETDIPLRPPDPSAKHPGQSQYPSGVRQGLQA